MSLLGVRPGGLWVDATLGGGGHAELMLERSSPDGIVIGIDCDATAVERAARRLERFGDRFRGIRANHAETHMVLERTGAGRARGILADLGVSSFQLDEAGRGFSFSQPGPIDMRMDNGCGQSALEWLTAVEEGELGRFLTAYGEEKNARRIARAIKAGLAAGTITDTATLASAVAAVSRKGGRIHPATRTFQAIRMAVNREPQSLTALLAQLQVILGPGGRAAIISFHSLEDRAVKRAFQELARGCVCPPDLPVCGCGRQPRGVLVTSGAITPSQEEIDANPRARSAKLRAVELH